LKVLWVPIFSMRSYDTGQYAINKDGNFQLSLSRILASNFDSIVIAVPYDCSDFYEFHARIKPLVNGRDITFKFLKYGANAVETRRTFWKDNQDYFFSEDILDFDLLITDISGYEGTMSYDIPFINNFNITKLPELNRPYIDEFFEQDLRSMKAALFTTVINPRQRDYILEVEPILADRVFAYTKVAHWHLMPQNHQTRLYKPNRTIFWPFRISDKAYKFNEFLEVFEASKMHKRFELVITDPNDSFTGEQPYIKKIKPSKDEYYKILQDMPIVIMLDDIDTVLHPGTIEFFHYGCQVITFENDLLPHKNMVHSIEDIPAKLQAIEYDRPSMINFVYGPSEISTLYCKEFVEKCAPSF